VIPPSFAPQRKEQKQIQEFRIPNFITKQKTCTQMFYNFPRTVSPLNSLEGCAA